MKTKKLLSILLTLSLLVSLLPATAIPVAADGNTMCKVKLTCNGNTFYANLRQTYSILEIAKRLGAGEEYMHANGKGPSSPMTTTANPDLTNYAVLWVIDDNFDNKDVSAIRFNRLCFGGTIGITVWKPAEGGSYDSLNMTVSVSPDIPFPGRGTDTNPYEINSEEAFLALSDYVIGDEDWKGYTLGQGGGKDQYFVLTTDLDFTNKTFYPVGWDVQREAVSAYFGGTFDGRGHTIKGARKQEPGKNSIGVFGILGYCAEIMNLRVADAEFSGFQFVGGIASKILSYYSQSSPQDASSGSIHDCWVVDSSIITGATNSDVGVIAGNCYGSGFHTNFSGNYYSGCTVTVQGATYGADQKGLAYGNFQNDQSQASTNSIGDFERAQWATAGDPTDEQRAAGLYSLKAANLNGKNRYIPLTAEFSPGGQEAYGSSLTYKYLDGAAIPITATLKGRDDYGNFALSVGNENITFHITDSNSQEVTELKEPGSYTLTAVTSYGTASCPLTVAEGTGYAANFHTVTWKDYDGTTLRTDHAVAEGMTLSYGAAPTRADAGGYRYTFAGWTPTPVAATADATYTATYTSEPIDYAIHYELEEGVDPGNPTSYNVESDPITLLKPTRANWGFAGWTGTGLDSATKAVTILTGSTGERTYTATWATLYNITLPAADGRSAWAVVDGETVTQAIAGDAVEVHITWPGGYICTPAVTGTESYEKDTPADRHIVLSFTMPAQEVSVSANYTAVQYTITWVDGDGNPLKTDTLNYGDTPAYSGETPTKTSTAELDYTFNGNWNPVITTVDGDQTYTAQFNQSTRAYTVTFLNWNNDVLQTGPVDYGTTPQYTGDVPQKDDGGDYTWVFTNWSPALTAVTGEATYTAQFEQTDKKNLAKCTAIVPNPVYTGYYIGYVYENADHGGIEVKDPDGNTLTYSDDYSLKSIVSLDDPDDMAPSKVGERCRVFLNGNGDWAGILTADIEILPPSGSGDWGDNLSWTFGKNDTTDQYELTITKKADAASGVMKAANYTYEYPWYRFCSNTQKIIFGEGVTSVADNAFAGEANLRSYANVTEVTLPSTLTTIGNRAFFYMSNLAGIDLSHVTTIGEMAFYDCSSLNVSVPATVTSIGEAAFSECQSASFILGINASANGTLNVSVDENPVTDGAVVPMGSTVTVNAVPDAGYAVRLTAKNANGKAVSVTNNQFVMPSSHVTVSAVFGRAVTVSDGITNGTVKADKAAAAENEPVTLTVSPDVGYGIGTVSYNDGEEHMIVPDAGVYSFPMPDKAVTVSATFTKLTEPAFNGHQLLLSGEIGVKFRVYFPDGYDKTGARVDFSVADGRISTMSLENAEKESENSYWFTCFVNALEIGDNITATLHYGTDSTLVNEYSVLAYCNYVQQHSEDYTLGLLKLANALQNYGYYMQQSGWTDGNSHTAMTPSGALNAASIVVAQDGLSNYGVVKFLEESGIS